ncbi:hypothetical protein HDV00_007091 [Rhizophlyctis rosea]|nr:hypothetical protein HDV00_007091 [Rhizophlyctis rosea]
MRPRPISDPNNPFESAATAPPSAFTSGFVELLTHRTVPQSATPQTPTRIRARPPNWSWQLRAALLPSRIPAARQRHSNNNPSAANLTLNPSNTSSTDVPVLKATLRHLHAVYGQSLARHQSDLAKLGKEISQVQRDLRSANSSIIAKSTDLAFERAEGRRKELLIDALIKQRDESLRKFDIGRGQYEAARKEIRRLESGMCRMTEALDQASDRAEVADSLREEVLRSMRNAGSGGWYATAADGQVEDTVCEDMDTTPMFVHWTEHVAASAVTASPVPVGKEVQRKKKTTDTAKTLHTSAFTANGEDDDHPDHENDEQKPRNLSAGLCSTSDGDNGLKDDSDIALCSPPLPSSASKQSERACAALVDAGQHSADITAEDERVNVTQKSTDGSARQAILRSKFDRSIAMANAMASEEAQAASRGPANADGRSSHEGSRSSEDFPALIPSNTAAMTPSAAMFAPAPRAEDMSLAAAASNGVGAVPNGVESMQPVPLHDSATRDQIVKFFETHAMAGKSGALYIAKYLGNGRAMISSVLNEIAPRLNALNFQISGMHVNCIALKEPEGVFTDLLNEFVPEKRSTDEPMAVLAQTFGPNELVQDAPI